MAHIEEIWVAPDKGVPMQSVDKIEAIAGVGLIGDRYALGKGAWSREKRNVVRHVSLIELETIEAVRSDGLPVTAGLARRNLVTSGIGLNGFVGRRLQVGEGGPILRGVELCDPCERPGNLSHDPALKQGLEQALRGRGGLRAEVLESGLITIDATIIMLDD